MTILAVAATKGGVGKSTTAMMLAETLSAGVHLEGAARAARAPNVLVIDCDHQAHATHLILSFQGLRHAAQASRTLADWARTPGADLRDIITSPVRPLAEHKARMAGTLGVIASNPEVRAHLAAPGLGVRLRRQLQALEPAWDIIILDCAPGLDPLSAAGLGAASHLVLPANPSHMALWSASVFWKDILQGEGAGPPPERRRILVTMLDAAGAARERAEALAGLRVLSGGRACPIHMRRTSAALRWQRPAQDATTTFRAKYGSEHTRVREMCADIAAFCGLARKGDTR